MATGPAARARPGWRSVAVPSEHGGWGLTLEPVALGLLVEPSGAGVLLGGAALLAFIARTPLRVVLVDRHRHRRLERTSLAARILVAEVVVIVGLVALATAVGDPRWWLPVVVAAPLVTVELWFDLRSRSRRLVPEVAGAAGMGAVAAAIVLAGGGAAALGMALWLVIGARVATSIPFVRDQVERLHGRAAAPRTVVAGDVAALALAALAVAIELGTLAGAIAIAGVVVYQRVSGRRPPDRAVVLGVRQTVVGATVVLVTALGVLAP